MIRTFIVIYEPTQNHRISLKTPALTVALLGLGSIGLHLVKTECIETESGFRRRPGTMISLSTIKSRIAPLVWLLSTMLIVLPISEHALAGVLICFESGGRVEIESGNTGDCASSLLTGVIENHGHRPVTTSEPAIQCASSCVDIPLFANPIDGNPAVAKQTSAKTFLMASVRILDDSSTFKFSSTQILSKNESLTPGDIGVKQSVVLLI
jgi:hypothetical protein